MFVGCMDAQNDLEKNSILDAYDDQFKFVIFCAKFFDEILEPNLANVFDYFPSGILSEHDKNEYRKNCNFLWASFEKKATEDYMNEIAATKWEEKENSFVNYRLRFSLAKKNCVNMLLNRQYNSKCNLSMQTWFTLPNFLSYKRFKSNEFAESLNTPIYWAGINGFAALCSLLHSQIEMKYVMMCATISEFLMCEVREIFLENVMHDTLFNLIKQIDLSDDDKMILFNFARQWAYNNVQSYGLIYNRNFFVKRFLKCFGVCDSNLIEDDFEDLIAYEGLYPKWMNYIEDMEVKEKCIFAHVLTVDIKLFIKKIHYEVLNFCLFLKEIIEYTVKFREDILQRNDDESKEKFDDESKEKFDDENLQKKLKLHVHIE